MVSDQMFTFEGNAERVNPRDASRPWGVLKAPGLRVTLWPDGCHTLAVGRRHTVVTTTLLRDLADAMDDHAQAFADDDASLLTDPDEQRAFAEALSAWDSAIRAAGVELVEEYAAARERRFPCPADED